jgi:hypothetical protein
MTRLDMLKTSGFLFNFVFLAVITSACGQDDSTVQEESGTLVSHETSSTLSETCAPITPIAAETISYCKTLPSGDVSMVELKTSTFVQDPLTCEVSSADDGIRSSMVEMGYEPCES